MKKPIPTKHIPTLSIVYYKQEEGYTYRWDDTRGLIQEAGLFTNLDSAMGDAAKRLKAFTLLEGIEEA
jgi:hypothetical protein